MLIRFLAVGLRLSGSFHRFDLGTMISRGTAVRLFAQEGVGAMCQERPPARMRSCVLLSQILGRLRIFGYPLRSIGDNRERLGFTRRDGWQPRHSRTIRRRVSIQVGLRELWTGNTHPRPIDVLYS